MAKLTFFLGPQVTQKDDGNFISQDKYVDEILKKFGFLTVKTTSIPMETLKPLLNYENAEDVDVYLYRSMIGSLMYVTSSSPDIMFVVCACARFQVTTKVSHLHDVKRIFRYLKGQPKLGLWYPKDSPFELEAYTDSDCAGASLDRKSTTGETADFAELVDFVNANSIRFLQLFLNNQIENLEAVFNDEYDTPSHTKKVFANIRRQGKDFSKRVTPLFETMLIQHPAKVGKGLEKPTEPQHTPTTTSPSHNEPIPTVASSSQPKKTQKHRKTKRKATEISQSSRPTTLVADETVHEEKVDIVERAATTAASLDAEQASGTITKTQLTAIPNELIPRVIGSGGSPRCQDTILGDRPTQTSWETYLKQTKQIYGATYTKLIKKGRKITEIDQDPGILLVQHDAEIQGRYDTAEKDITTVEPVTTVSAPITTTGVSVSTVEPSTPPTTTTNVIEDEDLIIAQTLMKIRIPPQKTLDPKDKGKGKMAESKTVQTKTKPQQEKERLSFEEAVRLQAELKKEERQGISRVHESDISFNGEEWEDIQARVEADEELVQRLQAEEREKYTKAEQARMLTEFINQRKKYFTAPRDETRRNKPSTQAQQRTYISNYIKNIEGYTLQQLRGYSFDEIKTLFKTKMFVSIESKVDRVVPKFTLKALGSTKRSSELEIILREGNKHLHAGREGVSIIKGNSYIDAGRKALGG
nr:hypothetical protein [Tanacetum cinerariifolium]